MAEYNTKDVAQTIRKLPVSKRSGPSRTAIPNKTAAAAEPTDLAERVVAPREITPARVGKRLRRGETSRAPPRVWQSREISRTR